ncbi:cAMP-binding domain of CRP or a regulatory subunit of cAMP-dependent protein kinases [Pedobacter steynii]|uniref:cAMP-binding domain of CRP or a regulatory subunit of cAMP-dependent protein kinases n=1 Tax=Pedobacter steynii TaxID=430522 RepID=A0A1H0KYX0_9SPHI|nr:Crp/Fnr family transcriptional regulator [Pedobacter steynii]NQX43367.1 Crp/Fnr family transcriptional regulator [Pedobacter steynii]SDO60973.1 cAMP-binding domain of CRP or a regulatory subunit of cAMP-dependent protein kinases [Pedobacter steynii]
MEEIVSLDEALALIEKRYLKLKPESRTALMECARIEVFERNAILVKEHQYSKSLMFMVKGALRAYYLKDGKDISDWFAFENDFICEINSFFLDKPSDHYFETLEKSTILILSKDSIMKLCDQYHDIERLARYSTTKTMIGLQRRLVSLQFETALQKYNNLLAVHPGIVQRVSLGHIASFLGITLETLSRIRNPRNGI